MASAPSARGEHIAKGDALASPFFMQKTSELSRLARGFARRRGSLGVYLASLTVRGVGAVPPVDLSGTMPRANGGGDLFQLRRCLRGRGESPASARARPHFEQMGW